MLLARMEMPGIRDVRLVIEDYRSWNNSFFDLNKAQISNPDETGLDKKIVHFRPFRGFNVKDVQHRCRSKRYMPISRIAFQFDVGFRRVPRSSSRIDADASRS